MEQETSAAGRADATNSLHPSVLNAIRGFVDDAIEADCSALRKELHDLRRRRDLAKRRLAAYENTRTRSSAADEERFLGTPAALAKMRARLEHADGNDQKLSELALELKNKKESLTKQALRAYADRCKRDNVFQDDND